MKATALESYQNISKDSVGKFTEDSSWQGAYVGRKKPYGYFTFENNSGQTKLSVKLVKESEKFNITTNED